MRIKKYLIVLMLVFLVSSLNARRMRRSSRALVELGPKISLYFGDETEFGIGCEAVFNPVRSIGFRLDLAEILRENITFYFNQNTSIDALFYYPMGGLQTYFLAGIGLMTLDFGDGSETFYSIRGGLGLNHPINPNLDLFIEPSLIFVGNGASDTIFRISGGIRFGVL